MELAATTILISFAGVFLICFMKGAFGGGFAIIGIPLLSLVMDPVTAGGLLAPLFIAMDLYGLRYWKPSTWSKPDLLLLVPGLVAGIGTGYLLFQNMATPRGARTVQDEREAFTRMMWDTWAPAGWYDPADFDEAARAFQGKDWAEVVLHSYRHRWGFAEGDPAYAEDEARLYPAPVLQVPTLVLHGGADTCNHPDSSQGREAFFQGGYERQVLDGVGHFPQREAPQAVADAILRFCGSA